MMTVTVPTNILILLVAGTTLIIAANLVLYVMIGEVNRKLPEGSQIGYLGFHPAKAFRIAREYRRLYPHGHLNALRIILTVVGGILIIACAARLSHFWR